MSTSNRIKKIVDMLPKVKLLADVGCDHGYVGVNALLTKKAEKVLFTDISLPSLKKAEKFAEQCGVLENCDFICGDGLCGQAVDCAVLAGMGGKEIVKILTAAPSLPDSVVLNPMKGIVETRKELQRYFFFEYDEIFFDKKYYWLMSLKKGCDNLSELQLKYGKTNLEHFCKDFCRYLFENIRKCDTILDKANCEDVRLRREELKKLLKRENIC